MRTLVNRSVLQHCNLGNPAIQDAIDKTAYSHKRDALVSTVLLSNKDLEHLREVAVGQKDSRSDRTLATVLAVRNGDYSKKVSSIDAFGESLYRYISQNKKRGWIFSQGDDGRLYAHLAVSIEVFPENVQSGGRNTPTTVRLKLAAYSFTDDYRDNKVNFRYTAFDFHPQDVVRKTLPDILAHRGLHLETSELLASYDATLQRYEQDVLPAFAEQFRFTGRSACPTLRSSTTPSSIPRKVINDISPGCLAPRPDVCPSEIFASGDEDDGNERLPIHPVIRVFDLKEHIYYWAHSDNLQTYQYDHTLGDKLVLPNTHRDLLDVLTTDTHVLTHDIIEGKSAGNIILCKGIPGVGKTLTAEVYAELTSKPLYSVHTGTLGTTPSEVHSRLQKVLDQVRRWKCVLLIDEADVFVLERGTDLTQNAIVAEFLRTLEYFDGLLFMTTNRSSSIDDAIVSRCAAVIQYEPPGEEQLRLAWKVMARQYDVDLSSELIDDLMRLLPSITPRDIKMLLRLAMRMAASRNIPLDTNVFRQCAMFRDITISTE